MNSIENLNDYINKIVDYTNNKKCKNIGTEISKKYFDIDSPSKSNFLREVSESLLWIAEKTKDSNSVKRAAECYLLDDVILTLEKYQGEVLNQVFANIAWTIEDSQNVESVKKYTKWLSNGWISKLLNFVSDFPTDGNLKLKRDIFSLLGVRVDGLEKFDELASKINGKKLFLEKKIELLSVLRDAINTKKEDYAESLMKGGIDSLRKTIEIELSGIKLPNTLYSTRCAVKFLENLKEDSNIQFLFKKHLEHGNLNKWLLEDNITNNVIKIMQSKGFNTDLYVASGKVISQKRTDGIFSEDTIDILKKIVISVVGSKRNNILPNVSIPRHSPGGIFKKIKNDYFSALNQDKEAMKRVLITIKDIIKRTFEKRKVPKSVTQVLNHIEGLEFVLNYGGVVSFRGAKVTAKVWKRKMPEDLYDSEDLWCCLFLPQGEKNEIPHIMMDPKTTILQFYIQGLNNPISISFFYAGLVDNEPTLLVDTWEGGGLVYAPLGQEKMKEFALDSMIKFAKKVGAKKLLIFANPKYSRAREFVNYLMDKGFISKSVCFESVDLNDSVLRTYSSNGKRHYTDAFQSNELKGRIDAVAIDC